MKDVKIKYNDTFVTSRSRDYYRGASFHWSGKWIEGAHYVSDDYNIDFVVHGQVLLACAKSHLSTIDNEPKDFIRDESGTVIGVASSYWDFVISGVVGNSPGIKIVDNYWYICANTGVPEEEQVWVNTGVKAKMELQDLSPEEIELLQEPGKEVVTEFVNNTLVQQTGQNTDKIMSQKAVTDELNLKATTAGLSAAINNEVLRANNTYQLKGDYATNSTVNALQEEVDDFEEEVGNKFDEVDGALSDLDDKIDTVEGEIPTKTSQLINDSTYQTRANIDTLLLPIKDVIPIQATAVNKLADKDFVNSSISTATADFKGTYDTLEELELQLANNNDYGFVISTDSDGNTVYNRYKYDGTNWVFEYALNNSSFTAAQWEAIQSGITSGLVTKLSDLPTNTQLTETLNTKSDKSTTVTNVAYGSKKLTKTINGTTSDVVTIDTIKSDLELTKSDVGLGNVDNTSDLNKPISTATQSALDEKLEIPDDTTINTGFLRRVTGRGLNINAKNADVENIEGKSQVWNQILENGNFANGTQSWYAFSGSFSVSNNICYFTYGGTGNGTVYSKSYNFTKGHTFFVSALINTSLSNGATLSFGAGGSYAQGVTTVSRKASTPGVLSRGSAIYSLSSDTNANTVFLRNFADFSLSNCFILDLTLLGINNLTTVEEVETWLAENIGAASYYPYNAGTILNNKIDTLKVNGFNQWDEEWEVGTINTSTGQNEVGSDRIRSKNYIPVFSGLAYYFKRPSSYIERVFYYNINKEFIEWVYFSNPTTIPAGVAYIRFNTIVNSGNTYNNDLCINISNSRNGQYEPYWENNIPIDVEHIYGQLNGTGELVQVFPDGMAGVNTVKDVLRIEDGVTVARKRIGKVDLGSLDWNTSWYIEASFWRIYASVPEKALGLFNFLNSKYSITDKTSANQPNKSILGNNNYSFIYIKDDSFSSQGASALIASLSGEMLYYELANPRLYTNLVYQNSPYYADGTPVSLPTYTVDKYGTETVVSDTLTTPLVANIHYYEANIKDLNVEGITNYVKRSELSDEFEKLAGIESGAQVNILEGVQVNGTDLPITNKKVNVDISGKVDKIEGKGLSTNDYTNEEKTKLGALPTKSELDDLLDEKVDVADSQTKADNEFIYRRTGNGLTIDANNARISELKGNSLVWNQMKGNNASTQSTTESNGVTLTAYPDNTYTLSGTASGRVRFSLFNVPVISGHKYLLHTSKDLSNIYIYDTASLLNSNNGFRVIMTASNSGTSNFYLDTYAASTAEISSSKFSIFLADLTLMFGAGNEPSTVAEFEALYPLPYYDYNAGAIINNEATAIETVGINQWDEETITGYYTSNGSHSPTEGQLCSKNYTRVLPNTDYYIKIPNSTEILKYNAGKNFMERINYLPNVIFNTGNAHYIKFNLKSPYGTTYNHDICINFYDASINGNYFPYEKHALELGLDSFDVKDAQDNVITVHGLKSAGSVHDSIDLARGKYIKRVGTVDLGTLNYATGIYNDIRYFASVGWSASALMKTDRLTTADMSNLVCQKYQTGVAITSVGHAQYRNDKTIVDYGANICINDSTYNNNTVDQFKTAMSGVYLNYELAKPVEYDLVGYINSDYIVNRYGTERALYNSILGCPFKADIDYYETNIKDIEIENMPSYLKREELTIERDKLETVESGAQANKIEHIQINGTEQTITDKTVNLPGSYPASDVSAWAKAETKPSYNFNEINGTVDDSQLPDTISSNIIGTALDLKSELKENQEFGFIKNDIDWDAKTAALKDVRGKSLVWNQLAKEITSSNYQNTGNCSVNNGAITIVGKTEGAYYESFSMYNNSQKLINGHKYYFGFSCTEYSVSVGTATSIRLYFGGVANNRGIQVYFNGVGRFAEIVSVSSDFSLITFGYANYLNTQTLISPDTFTIKDILCIDLTLMFGAGNEPSTVAEFEKMFPLNYYANNAGEIISNKTEQIESVGFNQCVEPPINLQMTGVDFPAFNKTKYTRVFGGVEYRLHHHALSVTNWRHCFKVFDLSGNEITRVSNAFTLITGGVYYTLSNYFTDNIDGTRTDLNITFAQDCYVYFGYGAGAVAASTPIEDFNLNFSDASRNGTYEPYKKDTIELNLSTLTGKLNGEGESVVVFPDGLKSAGSVYDEIVGNKAIKRVGVVDLGTLTWARNGNSGYEYFVSSEISGLKSKGYTNTDLVCAKYIAKGWTVSGQDDKCIRFSNSNDTRVWIRDFSYSDSPTFKTAMSGVLLYYELATPEEYILDTPIPDTFQAYKGGTLKQLPENTSTPTTTPMIADIQYGVTISDIVATINQLKRYIYTIIRT